MRKQNVQGGFSIIEVGIVVVVVAIIGFLGWKFYDTKVNQSQVNNAAQKAAVDMVPESLSELTEISKIQDDALTDKPGVTVVHLELEQSGDTLVYKAELSDGTVTVYNARTGARLRTVTATEKTSEVLPANITTGIGFAKALEIARAEKPGSKAYKIELELEGGVLVYSVRFSDKARVDVNAQTGEIVRTKAARTESSSSSASSGSSTSSEKKADDRSGVSSGSSSSDDSGSSSSNSGSSHDVDDDNSGRHSGDDDHDDDDDSLTDNDDDDDDDDHDDRDDDDSSNSGSGSDDRR